MRDRTDTGPFSSDEGRRSARLLEWPRLLDQVAKHCSLERGAHEVRSLLPLQDGEELARLWRWVDELRALIDGGAELPLGEMEDLRALLGDGRLESGPLSGESLVAIAGAARTLGEVLREVQTRGDRLTESARHLRGSEDPSPLADHLFAALEADGGLKDSASPRLGPLRRAVVAAQSRMRDAARREMGQAVAKGWTTGGEIVMRGERLCIPLRSGARGHVPGIVHDRSGSGGTHYVEPSSVIEAGNEWVEARLEVLEEERRILLALNQRVAERAPALVDLHERAVVLDAVRARARYGLEHRGQTPVFDRSTLRLEGFRHPLLRESLARAGRAEELVPLDLELDDDRVVLLSGPNAGGKTVVLKSVGLAVAMSQTAIPLPCAHPPRLPRVDHVLMDLGDEQSIADALSSFSAHLAHLRRVLALATPCSLVLLDEIGGGTDPQEGVALARGALEFLAGVGCRTVVTTHYGQLKMLVEEDERFRHASMAFDHQALRPRFALQLDLPGASHALEIAERMQLPSTVVERARALVGDDRLRLDELLRALDEQRGENESLGASLAEQLDAARLSRQRYDRLARELKEARRERLRAAEREAEGIVRNARRRIETLLRRIREAGGDEQAVEAARVAREEIEERGERLRERVARQARPVRPARPPRIEVGSAVRHVGLGQVGVIVAVDDERITLEIGETRVVARAEQLAAPEDSEALAATRRVEGTIRTQLVDAQPLSATRVDVRGLDAEDAWRLVDRAVDRCLVTGMRELEVVHGHGTGRLRAFLGERLARDPRVQEVHLGDEGRRDEGMTLVRI